jgi:hypothetical protein
VLETVSLGASDTVWIPAMHLSDSEDLSSSSEKTTEFQKAQDDANKRTTPSAHCERGKLFTKALVILVAYIALEHAKQIVILCVVVSAPVNYCRPYKKIGNALQNSRTLKMRRKNRKRDLMGTHLGPIKRSGKSKCREQTRNETL